VKHVALFAVSAAVVLPTATFGAPPPGPPNPTIVAPALHELARLDAPVCGHLVVHANSAISGILHGDGAIRLVVARLRAIDVDGPNPVSRRAALQDLEHLAADLTDRSHSVDGEIKRLRDTLSPTPGASDETAPTGSASAAPAGAGAHPTDLRAFVEALSDAVGRQRHMAADLTTFTANLENREMRDDNIAPDDATGRRQTSGPTSVFGTAAHQSAAIFESARLSAREMAIATAGDFETRSADIKRDESRAAEFSEAAVAGCN
jgi:hypothetical protein